MSSSEVVFQTIQREWQTLQPLLPTYVHLLASALIPIYAGAHASLTRPSSAAKPSKVKKKTLHDDASEDEFQEEAETKIEGLSASDAIWFPVLAGCTLGGLYLIIKWLEDPALLNKILNWYFAIFGVIGVAKMFKDSADVLVSYVFPSKYLYHGQIWKFDESKRLFASQKDASQTQDSPLPGRFSKLPLPSPLGRVLWTLRSSQSTLCVRMNFDRSLKSHIHITPMTVFSFLIAVAVVLYYNLIARPWYLTNILGYAFAYNALQLISPSTSWTGTLILGSLFLYDIYFVFFTPLMVTVATQLDIPAKLLFPRPAGPSADPAKQSLSMLGLGDVVLPGMMIGFALRLDLYLFYLSKQTRIPVPDNSEAFHSAEETSLPTEKDVKENPGAYIPDPTSSTSLISLLPFAPATSHWGTRFWTSSLDPSVRGALFPKPYFTASMCGYVAGMVLTLGVMQVTGHAQPALFYLVPCVLVGFWGTAVYRRQVRVVWNFDESEKDGEKGKELEKKGGKEDKGSVTKVEKKASAGGLNSKRRVATGDFFSLDLRVGWTQSTGTKKCAREAQKLGKIARKED